MAERDARWDVIDDALLDPAEATAKATEALDSLEAEFVQRGEEIERERTWAKSERAGRKQERSRADAAEAEVVRLQEALREIDALLPEGYQAKNIARAALAGTAGEPDG